MIRIPLPEDDAALLLLPRWSDLEPLWSGIFLALLLLVPALFVGCLYRYEMRLVKPVTALGLLLLRLGLVLVLWSVVGFQPMLAHFHIEEEPSQVLVAVDLSQSMGVVDPQRSTADKLRLARALRLDTNTGDDTLERWISLQEKDATLLDDADKAQVDTLGRRVDQLKRVEIAHRILSSAGADLLARLHAQHKVKLAGFHKTLWEATGLGALLPAEGTNNLGTTTDLTLPLRQALELAGAKGDKLLGIALLTDGLHNASELPTALAKELGRRKIAIFPVALGARQPPIDLALVEVQAPSNIFKDTEAPIDVRVKATGVPAQEVVVELLHEGKLLAPTHRQVLKHDGANRTYAVHFQCKLEKLGAHTLEVKVQAADKSLQEVTRDNNVQSAVVRVLKDKARVLLVDGEARWEYHYLANALARDPAIALERVLFVQPRLGLVKDDVLEKIGYARTMLPARKDEKADPLEEYDCILVGDVSPGQLALAERRRLEKYVADRGGTLVFLAGKRYMPQEFLSTAGADDPLLRMLPLAKVKAATPPSGFALALTAEGTATPFLQLELQPDENLKRWAELPRHYWGVTGTLKPGAAVLAYLPEALQPGKAPERAALEKSQGIVITQGYGFGRVLFLGLDSTWRWRFREGDTYHHRFWGQLVRWAASDRILPAGNKYVRFGSRLPVYRQGQEAEVEVRLGEAAPPPATKVGMRILRQLGEGKEELVAVVPLNQQPQQAKVFAAKVSDLPAGKYRLEPDIPGVAGKRDEGDKSDRLDTFTVLPPENGEMTDLATNWELLKALAEHSGGTVLNEANAAQLVDLLGRRIVRRELRDEQRLWQDAPLVWWLLAILLGFLTVEWLWRKAAGLA